ncbi:unnamed protein product [Nesidiocoris tenuis]|uniref:Uncharacterized protein n=1 Tax=Nesidiocoris tenuis TaxID=355587 RepID=A0A6H5G851_9HEMI|nr:unnamed protein product [Nesidiocoris tenuis]
MFCWASRNKGGPIPSEKEVKYGPITGGNGRLIPREPSRRTIEHNVATNHPKGMCRWDSEQPFFQPSKRTITSQTQKCLTKTAIIPKRREAGVAPELYWSLITPLIRNLDRLLELCAHDGSPRNRSKFWMIEKASASLFHHNFGATTASLRKSYRSIVILLKFENRIGASEKLLLAQFYSESLPEQVPEATQKCQRKNLIRTDDYNTSICSSIKTNLKKCLGYLKKTGIFVYTALLLYHSEPRKNLIRNLILRTYDKADNSFIYLLLFKWMGITNCTHFDIPAQQQDCNSSKWLIVFINWPPKRRNLPKEDEFQFVRRNSRGAVHKVTP